MDGKVGVEFESGEVKNCENCPLNQYAEDGSGKQCKKHCFPAFFHVPEGDEKG
jgi:hypothetical protein